MKFYVYYYINEQGLPYYVGKGCGKRAFARHNYTMVPPKERIKFLISGTSEEWALYKEAAFIDHWGTLADGTGTLENTCDKPHPTRKGPHSPETIEKLRESNKKFWEGKERKVWNKGVSGYSTSWAGRSHTEETKKKLSVVAKGNKRRLGMDHTEESKEHQRNNHPGCRSVIILGITYRSVSEASRQLGVGRKTIRNFLAGKTSCSLCRSTARAVVCGSETFRSLTEAARAHGLNKTAIKWRLESRHWEGWEWRT